MKFAKKLQEESYQEWNDKYLDYKLMKKVLKQGSPDAMVVFCKLLESQLLKVHDFMRGRQEVILGELSPLEAAADSVSPSTRRAIGSVAELLQLTDEPMAPSSHCQQLVQDIENFRGYASLNAVAVRKIIKKFDKRFQVHFHERFGHPCTTRLLVTERDIASWLLHPAQECLRLMGLLHATAPPMVERPLRQFHFWVAELRAGAQLTQLRVSGAGAVDTPVLLQLRDEQPGSAWRVKNTFIDAPPPPAEGVRRSRSLPPSPAPAALLDGDDSCEADEAGCCEAPVPQPILRLEDLVCQPESPTAHPRHLDGCDDTASAPGSPLSQHSEDAPEDLPGPRGPSASSTSAAGSSAAASSTAPAPPERARRAPRRPPGLAPRQGAAPAAPSSRWWEDVPDTCPVTGFPVRLLPYPPFKLQVQDGSRLVDGPYVALCVLASWRFEVLGRPLTGPEICQLDAYMKRCKLGPFRLGRALDLLAAGTSDARREFDELRAKAHARLEHLRRIQRARLCQQEAGEPAAPPPRQRHRPPPQQRRQQPSDPSRGREPAAPRRPPPPRQPLPVGACVRPPETQ